MFRSRLSIAIAAFAIILAACSSGATPTPVVTPGPGASAGAEIGCDTGGHDAAYHIHSLVGVKVDGSLYAPPANIGITTCMYWVHTHKADGIVHVEAPASVHPTLGDFLDIWGETYPDDQLLAQAREAIAAGEVTVDDQPYAGDARALQLADKLRIILGS